MIRSAAASREVQPLTQRETVLLEPQSMNKEPLANADYVLVQAAEQIIRNRYAAGRHHVGAALRSGSGRIFYGLHLDSAGIDICAEAIALGTATSEGVTDIELVVAVLSNGTECAVVPPCGTCRELFQTFAPDARAIISINGDLFKVAFRDLLPCCYTYIRRPSAGKRQSDV